MDRAAPSLVPGVERSQQVDDLGAPALPDDQAIGTHAQGLPDQVAQGHLARALDVGCTSGERDDVRMVGHELGQVLDEHEAFMRRDEAERASPATSSSPLPVPPETRNDSRPAMTSRSSRAPRGPTAPAASSAGNVHGRRAGTRSDSTVPGRATGGRTACRRVPSASRTSHHGAASSRRRPTEEASRCASRRTADSSAKQTPVRSSPLPAVDPDRVVGVDQDIGDLRVGEQHRERSGTHQLVAQRTDHGKHCSVAEHPTLGPQRGRDPDW